MLVVGARGFAKQLVDDLLKACYLSTSSICPCSFSRSALIFFDDVSSEIDPLFQEEFRVIRSFEEVTTIEGRDFILGVAGCQNREKLYNKFSSFGFRVTQTISVNASVSETDTIIQAGVNILSRVIVEPSAEIGLCSLINVGSNIHHDVKIGKFVEISPCVCLCGGVEVGDSTFIGASATVLPRVKIGKNVTIGAGAVVTKDVADNTTLVGVPARIME
jgi:sugar O-acyltransferase (sialic acid O-acetyltransferase NeuD family)